MVDPIQSETSASKKTKRRAVVVRPFHLGAGVVSLAGLIGGGGFWSSSGLGTKLDDHHRELATRLEEQKKEIGELKLSLVKFEARAEALEKLDERLATNVDRAVDKVHELERVGVQISTRQEELERRLQVIESGRKQ